MRRAFLLLLLIVQAFVPRGTTMPSADFCHAVKAPCDAFSHDSETHGRSPAIRLTAFNAQPPDLQPAPLTDVDFAVNGQLVRHRMPHIRFLSIGSRLCSTLPSDAASRRRPCASLSLLLHQDVKRTCTSKLSIMRGVPQKCPRRTEGMVCDQVGYCMMLTAMCSMLSTASPTWLPAAG